MLLFFACRGADRGSGAQASAVPARSVASAPAQPAGSAAVAARWWVEPRWDSKTGKGDVIHHFPNGDLLRTCLHCGYPGYTGGLLVGNYGGFGLGFYPAQPIRGYRQINVFCAQDESIWDRDERQEYSYGWSENFGRGDDGVRLEYQGGRVVEAGPERVVMESVNAGGCYEVHKVATTRRDARWWIMATRITNRCQKPVHFDFFTGDDPWIGTYRSSEGDVGYTSRELVRHERFFQLGEFTEGGLYDLGNREAGEKELGFSGQANFMTLDPGVERPNLAAFANSFAHSSRDVNPKRPLDNRTMTALNLGWTDRRLAPREGLTLAFALGLADAGPATTDGTPPLPRVPTPSDEDWSLWRQYLGEGRLEQHQEQVSFASERVELELTEQSLSLTGTYWLRNHGRGSEGLVIAFPILTAADRPAPTSVLVDGRSVPVVVTGAGQVEARFSVTVAPRSIKSFRVQYQQPHRGRKAVYVVTSARRWGQPLVHATFVVRYARALGRVRLRYPATRVTTQNSQVEMLVVRQPFLPEHEFELSW